MSVDVQKTLEYHSSANIPSWYASQSNMLNPLFYTCTGDTANTRKFGFFCIYVAGTYCEFEPR